MLSLTLFSESEKCNQHWHSVITSCYDGHPGFRRVFDTGDLWFFHLHVSSLQSLNLS